MALDLKQNLKLTQQLLMTPQLQQAIKLLQLSRAQLSEFIEDQLSENPLLEESAQNFSEEHNYEDQEKEKTPEDLMIESLMDQKILFESSHESVKTAEKEVFLEDDSSYQSGLSQFLKTNSFLDSDEEGSFFENTISYQNTLSDHLLAQIAQENLSEDERQIAAVLIGFIDEKGYFEGDLAHVCHEFSFDFDLAEGVLDVIQRLEPEGVGARDLKECLFIQLREKFFKEKLARRIVLSHLDLLEKRDFLSLSKILKTDLEEIKKAWSIIRRLDPVPARNFSHQINPEVIPDVYAVKIKNKWQAVLNEDGLPPLRLTEFFNEYKDAKNQKEKEYVSEKIRSAQWLMRSLLQRQKTILKVAQSIVLRQQDFLEKGVAFLKPMILKDIADDIGMHESTVSRVTTNKYIHTKRGIFELKYFFTGAIQSANGEDVASESVKALIKSFVEKENSAKPFSDQKIAQFLEEKGLQIARRTIAKYREQMGILPSSKRKKFF